MRNQRWAVELKRRMTERLVRRPVATIVDESGQALSEYAFMTVLIAVVCASSITLLGSEIDGMYAIIRSLGAAI